MTAETWLDLRNVEAWQGDRPVLHELNLQLKLRQSTTVLGPNGAGKSSLVKLIDRSLYPIVRPDAHLRLFGSETVNLWALRSRLGVVSSELEQRLHPKTAVEEVVVSSFFGPPGWAAIRTQALSSGSRREICSINFTSTASVNAVAASYRTDSDAAY